jgi:asparagine synthase (glutamine-hydrolysing)
MCGIAGVLRTVSTAEDVVVVGEMLARLTHRGPGARGLVSDGPVTMGHRRLPILDLSERAAQPMRSRCGRYLVTYNGEIYNFRDLARELGAGPETLSTRSDTEILLLAWERWGPPALDRFVGQWAFALYDSRERRLWLARDRFGEKPLFYHQDQGVLTFASSIAALVCAPWVPREIDPASLIEYLSLRYVVSPRTILTDVRKLAPGHLLCSGPDGVSIRRWYEPRIAGAGATLPPRRTADLVEEFGGLLEQAAKRCLVSDVPVALLLSEGIDSHAIHTALGRGGAEIQTYHYTAVMNGEPPAPAPARASAREVEVPVTTDERFRSLVPVLSSLTEPVGDGASLALWCLIRRARSAATVFLSGHGGDEILCGYRLSQDLFRLRAIHLFSWLPESWIGRAIGYFTNGAETTSARLAALRRVRAPLIPAIARYLVHRPLSLCEVRSVAGSVGTGAPYLETVDRLYAECPENAVALDRAQEVMLRSFLPEVQLSVADSVAMACSAELRLPYLDRDLVDFVLRLPPSLRSSRWPGHANTKRILRLWGRNRLPHDVLTRRKRSFRYGSIRGMLADRGDAVRDLVLGSTALRRALPGLDTWVRRPAHDFHGPMESTFWSLLSLGIWCEASGVR